MTQQERKEIKRWVDELNAYLTGRINALEARLQRLEKRMQGEEA